MKESRALQTADRVVLEWARWTRSERDNGADAETATANPAGERDGGLEPEREIWRNVRWVQQSEDDHWFIYEGADDPSSRQDKSAQEIKTVLHVKDSVLTWIRRGAAEWRHQFEAGQQFSSVLQTGPLVLDVVSSTHRLDVSIEADKGDITMDYSLDLSGELQRVQTHIRFFKEGLYEQQEGPEGLA